MWDPQSSVLKRAAVVEYPGHGEALLTDVDGIAGLADRVLKAVDGPFSFVGLSLGAAIGIHLASEHSDRLERLVLACPSARFGDPEEWQKRAATVRREGLTAVVDAVMSRWFTATFDGVERYRKMFLSVQTEGYARCCEALADWDGTKALARIEAPTLVIAAAHDTTSPPEHGREIAESVKADFAVISGAAHLVNAEQAEAFNWLLTQYL